MLTELADTDEAHEPLAILLYETFDMRFQRVWEDLPEEIRMDYIEAAYDFQRDLRAKGLCVATTKAQGT